ncbi:MAG: WYL domain-containing protein [Sedimentibacter sp.]|uniref:helix-turn-helix transcriptional regulator n=1 Tax=Sedimentibacter sp. TaxID=1960295 RepID=UPI0029810AFC|nr:WYL domain-containing protein [Sedimentibacter sp.]MDW5299560.1 WYL domain-containing protein [Sedimentibacter sp.]
MSKLSNQKLKLLYLLKILNEKTDTDHTLTVPEMILELKKYNISAERKSIYDDIESLKVSGIDILCRKSKTYDYFIASRTFELAELKLLADAVASSKFITEKKSRELIKKIGSLTSNHEAKQLVRQVYVAGRVKTINERIYYNVDIINQAIGNNKQITFKYFEYTIDKKKRYRNDGNKYIASPYALTWDDENYYMISYYEKYNGITHFRVDKMEDIEITDQKCHKEDINIVEYTKKIFSMYGGEEETVKIQFDNSLLGVVIDRFGKSTITHKIDENNFAAILTVELSPPFWGWIFQFGNKAKIISPENVREKFVAFINEVMEEY